MTQEDKELLLKDICARLYFGIKVEIPELETRVIYEVVEITRDSISVKKDNGSIFVILNTIDVYPYLRSMSSMTDEEKEELSDIRAKDNQTLRNWLSERTKTPCPIIYGEVDFCNKHHFDYRRLIEKGLALEASEGMYNI